MLITSDGQWNHRVTSPNKKCFKHYQVTLENPIEDDYEKKFLQGIQLKGESKVTLPAQLTIVDQYHAELAIQEGKYHQVKRMFAALSNHVTELHRFRIGDLDLDKTLNPGEYRPLSEDEVLLFA